MVRADFTTEEEKITSPLHLLLKNSGQVAKVQVYVVMLFTTLA
jgi:hypothetical protein